MARTRDDDDDYEDAPRRRRDDDEDPPRRRRRDDDDFDDDRPPAKLGPLDKTFRDTNIVVLVLFGCCCSFIAFILSLVAYLTAQDPKAKSNATIVLVISGIITVLNVVATVTGNLAQLIGGNR